MTQHEALIDLFRRNGGRLTLGEILRHPFGYEWRARKCELKKKGYFIELVETNRQEPSKNTYVLIEPEANGQMRMAI